MTKINTKYSGIHDKPCFTIFEVTLDDDVSVPDFVLRKKMYDIVDHCKCLNHEEVVLFKKNCERVLEIYERTEFGSLVDPIDIYDNKYRKLRLKAEGEICGTHGLISYFKPDHFDTNIAYKCNLAISLFKRGDTTDIVLSSDKAEKIKLELYQALAMNSVDESSLLYEILTDDNKLKEHGSYLEQITYQGVIEDVKKAVIKD